MIGAVAQLGERDVRNVEVRGSIPLGSTNYINGLARIHWPFCFFWHPYSNHAAQFHFQVVATTTAPRMASLRAVVVVCFLRFGLSGRCQHPALASGADNAP